MAVLNAAEARKFRASKHAGRSEKCQFCGRYVFGNGGKVSHARAHVRRGEAVELVRYYGYPFGHSRLFLAASDTERIAKWEADDYYRVE